MRISVLLEKVCHQLERRCNDNGKHKIHRQEYCKQRNIATTLIICQEIFVYPKSVTVVIIRESNFISIFDKVKNKSMEPVLPSSNFDHLLADCFEQKIKSIRNSVISDSQSLSTEFVPWILSSLKPTSESESKKIKLKSPPPQHDLDPNLN